MTGLVVVVAVLAAATAFGLWRRARDGRVVEARVDEQLLGPEELGAPLGERATLVQFSTAFCQPCRAARATLAHVAADTDGVVHVEIDAEHHLDLVRRLNILRTPTTLVLDGSGRIVRRATGAPRLADVRAALPALPA
ncbi:thioredoxin family protein [Jiangella rhizosphaerae]|uniref:Thioredoxin n=1 Tax=Jiangella rhizosphaerae TaxID=2293569 RepID=A0A418KVM8_9ACTN|nr:thioredoxin family protein [Jiangella rhizosphaerae]RIQ34110.1 thioredoxin [Jiangella rhizosphaerae]